ncbi:MAG: sensor histidine kinase, partial [Sphingomonas sp.]
MRRFWPASLFGRLLLLSGAATLVALVIAGFAIGQVLEREVMRGLDERLDTQVALLARAVRPDGTLDGARVI